MSETSIWDRGRPLLVVRVSLPESGALNSLPELLGSHLLANILRAHRLFRSRTLPLPGKEARLLPGHIFEMGELSRLLDDTLRKGISDKTVRDKLLQSPARQENDVGSRVYTRLLGTGDDKRFETVEVGALLGSIGTVRSLPIWRKCSITMMILIAISKRLSGVKHQCSSPSRWSHRHLRAGVGQRSKQRARQIRDHTEDGALPLRTARSEQREGWLRTVIACASWVPTFGISVS